MQHLSSLNMMISEAVVAWNSTFPKYPTEEYLRGLICEPDQKIACSQIAPIGSYHKKIIYYHNCKACLYAAVKRQCTAVPSADPNVINQFQEYVKNIITPELKEIMMDFDYSYPVWYNHLTSSQQKLLEKNEEEGDNEYYTSIFCKSEKQQLEDNGDMPKNRCISNMSQRNKYVMGPIVYFLEQLFKKKFKGYGSGKSFDEKSKIYNEWRKRNYKIYEDDTSGWDRSIKLWLKKLVFFEIYNVLKEMGHIKHISYEEFSAHAFAEKTEMRIKFFEKNGTITNFGKIILEGLVFSGSSDTTFANTALNAIIHRFICEWLLQLIWIVHYQTAGAGDDNSTGIVKTIPTEVVKEAYYKVYIQAKYTKNPLSYVHIKHGLGLTMKYLLIGETEDITFCSTNTFFCKTCGNHRVIRKLDRFLELTPWSNSILKLSNDQRETYKYNLAVANDCWMRNLPIYRILNRYLYLSKPGKDYNLDGPMKKTMPLTKEDIIIQDKFFIRENVSRVERMSRLFGKDKYAMIGRTQNLLDCCVNACYDDYAYKYGWSRDDVDMIERDMQNFNEDGIYNSKTLEEGFAYNRDVYQFLVSM